MSRSDAETARRWARFFEVGKIDAGNHEEFFGLRELLLRLADQSEENVRLEAERDALLKKDYEEMDHDMWREVDRLRAEVGRLQAERDYAKKVLRTETRARYREGLEAGLKGLSQRDEENTRLQGEASRFRDLLFRKGEEVGKLRALVEAARESAHGEVGWSKFDRLLAEWDEGGGGR